MNLRLLYYVHSRPSRPFLKPLFLTSPMGAITKYFHDSIEEMKKITWPTKKQTINNTLIVIVMSVAFALFFAALDYIFRTLISSLI